MNTFSIRNLREHVGELVLSAETGSLSLVTKRGKPVFLAVPFDDEVIGLGLHVFLAMEAYQKGSVSLEKAAKMAKLSLEDFIERLAESNIPIINYQPNELKEELSIIKKLKKQEK